MSKRVRATRRASPSDRVKLSDDDLMKAGFLDEKALHRKKFGDFNDYPPNWKPCGAEEFWSKFFMYGVGKTEIRQMMRPKDVHLAMHHHGERVVDLIDAMLFIYEDGTGLAMVPQRDLGTTSTIAPKLYKFAVCEHHYVMDRNKSKMFHTVSKCDKCGDVRIVDSKD